MPAPLTRRGCQRSYQSLASSEHGASIRWLVWPPRTHRARHRRVDVVGGGGAACEPEFGRVQAQPLVTEDSQHKQRLVAVEPQPPPLTVTEDTSLAAAATPPPCGGGGGSASSTADQTPSSWPAAVSSGAPELGAPSVAFLPPDWSAVGVNTATDRWQVASTVPQYPGRVTHLRRHVSWARLLLRAAAAVAVAGCAAAG
eukprot:COSAG01_NODE_20505_length_949_cov_0.682726_1_plen_199_part_00